MNKFGKPHVTPHKDWDQEKVGMRFYLTLIQHPVFKKEPKAINEAHSWLNDIAAAMLANDGNPVTWGHKNIQDRFRKFAQSHVDFLAALQKLNLICITQLGHCRQFGLPTLWALADGNYRWLHLLITDPKIRRRNQVAIAGRKKRRTVYADPTKRIVDDFRHGVKFERDGLLKQLRVDNHSLQSRARERLCSVVHPLLAFETRKFCELKLNKGKIYHEFISLPWNYRRFALFKGKPYIAFLDIKDCQPKFAGSLPCDLFPTFYAFGENLGLTLVYQHDGVSIFADRNDTELAAKLEKVKAFIQQQLAENPAPQVA